MRILASILITTLLLSILSGCTSTDIHIASTVPSASAGSATTAIYPDSVVVRPDPTDIDSFRINPQEQELLQLIHDLRADALVTDETLCALAYFRAQEAFRKFSHERPDGSSYTSVFTQFGYTYLTSEEVAIYTESNVPMNEVLASWLLEGHVAEKLNDPKFTHVGIGVCKNQKHMIVVCLLVQK